MCPFLGQNFNQVIFFGKNRIKFWVFKVKICHFLGKHFRKVNNKLVKFRQKIYFFLNFDLKRPKFRQKIDFSATVDKFRPKNPKPKLNANFDLNNQDFD